MQEAHLGSRHAQLTRSQLRMNIYKREEHYVVFHFHCQLGPLTAAAEEESCCEEQTPLALNQFPAHNLLHIL